MATKILFPSPVCTFVNQVQVNAVDFLLFLLHASWFLGFLAGPACGLFNFDGLANLLLLCDLLQSVSAVELLHIILYIVRSLHIFQKKKCKENELVN